MTLVRLEPAAPRSRVKHSDTTEPLCSLMTSLGRNWSWELYHVEMAQQSLVRVYEYYKKISPGLRIHVNEKYCVLVGNWAGWVVDNGCLKPSGYVVSVTEVGQMVRSDSRTVQGKWISLGRNLCPSLSE